MDGVISFLNAAIVAGTPILFATLGEIITERSGNLNLGVEGMMLMGAVMAGNDACSNDSRRAMGTYTGFFQSAMGNQ